jgi:cysteine-rich repeat protein
MRLAIVVAASASALGIAGPARADKASESCRGAIAKSVANVIKAGLKDADSCHKAADKAASASGTGACNDTSNAAFDPKGKYSGAKTKGSTLIGIKCPGGNPVLTNYTGSNPTGALYPVVDSTVGGNSLLIIGNSNLAGDKAKKKCLEAVAKDSAGIVNEVVKNSVKCQKGKDKGAASFGQLDPTCVDVGAKSTGKANVDIPAKCGTLTGADVGSCSPLPSCAVNAAVGAGQDLAKAIYQTLPVVTQTCGNGIVEGTEQCDDGNTIDGDGCNHLCEIEGNSCTPSSGHRIVTVNLNIPGGAELAGVSVGFNYPAFEITVPGQGNSSLVNADVQYFPSGGLHIADDENNFFSASFANATEFISSGALYAVHFQTCTALNQNVCSRNPNVFGCCPDADVVACNADPEGNPTACYCGSKGIIKPSDCTAAGCTLGQCAPGALDGPPGSCDGTGHCTAGNVGHTCTTPTETVDCAGATIDPNTCKASFECGRVGDFANNGSATHGCATIFDPPICTNGHFPSETPGTCDNTITPVGGCPSNNNCVNQAQITEGSCQITDPVDHLGQPVAGVTCQITVIEGSPSAAFIDGIL